MLSRLSRRLSYANVMSTLAVFVALGGTGAYAANEWNSSNIQDETLTGADVKGRVGTYSDPAVNGSLTTYDIAGHAANAGNGTRFIDGSLTGQDIRDNSLVGADVNESTFNLAEPWHEVGAPGEPAFNDGLGPGIFCYWTNVDSTFNSAAFLRDRSGIVRLKGFVRANDGGAVCGNPGNAELDKRIFSLPPGYRPARIEIHTALSNSALGQIHVNPFDYSNPAAVRIDTPTTFANAKQWVSLDGISFRCAPSGQNGCP